MVRADPRACGPPRLPERAAAVAASAATPAISSRLVTPAMWTPPPAASTELRIVGGRPVDRRDLLVAQPQVHRQLAAMMRQVIDGVAQHDVPRLVHDDLATGAQPPVRGVEVVVVRLQQRLTGLLDVAVVH